MSDWDNSEEQRRPEHEGGLISRLSLALVKGTAFLTSRFGLLALGLVALIAIIYLTVSADGFVRQNQLAKEKQKLEAQIEVLQDENRVLRQMLERLQTDPGYVEDEARKKLGLIKPGETVYRLSEEPDLKSGQEMEPPVIP
ncbi:septum formation initiator family protein [Deltaproteobacteria bacterium OttesenSCG-928-K17]|nr:septum formation initiator family protein [Deltaproteobacteria bacterium OttesenSCG-928-K17]